MGSQRRPGAPPLWRRCRVKTPSKEPVVTTSGQSVVLDIRGTFTTAEAAEITAAVKRAIDFANQHRPNFYSRKETG